LHVSPFTTCVSDERRWERKIKDKIEEREAKHNNGSE